MPEIAVKRSPPAQATAFNHFAAAGHKMVRPTSAVSVILASVDVKRRVERDPREELTLAKVGVDADGGHDLFAE